MPTQVRVFVAGDKASVGKSTVCLGLLSSLLSDGYEPHELCYIKPATQSIASTLTASFCEARGIPHQHIGPIVFYRGFTQEFLDGKSTRSSQQMLHDCKVALERISTHAKVVIIDGVGYPSVGSVVGTSNADIAQILEAPVLIVGKSGIGDAIDSFELCASFFATHHVPVIGAVFNKVAVEGFYARDKCNKYVKSYFSRHFGPHHERHTCYGHVPIADFLTGGEEDGACSFTRASDVDNARATPLTKEQSDQIDAFTPFFQEHVDFRQIIQDAGEVRQFWHRRRQAHYLKLGVKMFAVALGAVAAAVVLASADELLTAKHRK